MYSGIQYNTTYYPQPHMRHLFPKASYDSNTKYDKYDHNKLYGEYDTNRHGRRSSSDQYSDGDVRNFLLNLKFWNLYILYSLGTS